MTALKIHGALLIPSVRNQRFRPAPLTHRARGALVRRIEKPCVCVVRRTQCVEKASQNLPHQRQTEFKSFSTAACTWAKILLRLQVWNLFVCDEQILRAADCKNLSKSPEGDFRQSEPCVCLVRRCHRVNSFILQRANPHILSPYPLHSLFRTLSLFSPIIIMALWNLTGRDFSRHFPLIFTSFPRPFPGYSHALPTHFH